jgi:hypothetical protein
MSSLVRQETNFIMESDKQLLDTELLLRRTCTGFNVRWKPLEVLRVRTAIRLRCSPRSGLTMSTLRKSEFAPSHSLSFFETTTKERQDGSPSISLLPLPKEQALH